LAEYIVAHALDVAGGVRVDWAAYDLTTADGTRIEVKSAAYIQSWRQKRPSPISFGVRETRAWDRESSTQSKDVRRQADVYVFALLAHQDQSSIEPLDVSQWDFFAVPTMHLDTRTRSQHSITLKSLRTLAGDPVKYSGLRNAVEVAAKLQKKLVDAAMKEDRPSDAK
jgi:hypothetical protein